MKLAEVFSIEQTDCEILSFNNLIPAMECGSELVYLDLREGGEMQSLPRIKDQEEYGKSTFVKEHRDSTTIQEIVGEDMYLTRLTIGEESGAPIESVDIDFNLYGIATDGIHVDFFDDHESESLFAFSVGPDGL